MPDERSSRRTKIVATLGPASADPDTMRRLLQAGVNVVRVNSSHGDPATWGEWIDRVHQMAAELGRHVGVLVDLQGPRIRVGDLPQPLPLAEGSTIVLAPEETATPEELPTTYGGLAADVVPGARILLDDGLLELRVEDIAGDRVRAVVEHGGELKPNKGMNLPGIRVSAPAFTDQDRETLDAVLKYDIDFVGISFVRSREDIDLVRKTVPEDVQLVAKIERAAAVESLEEIVAAADAIMVARGDLGVELPFEEVPLIQKRLIEEANLHAKPVITATQMLESMVRNPRPTRAEASDVANAILDGTDAVMLSAETAVGRYPIEAVLAMARIIGRVEQTAGDSYRIRRRGDEREGRRSTVEDAIATATTAAAETLAVPAIVCITKSGFTARTIAALRPASPILGLSTELSTCRCLSLVWGVVPMLVDYAPTYEVMVGRARERLVREGYVQPGDRIAVTAGVPFDVPGTTNLLKISTV